MKKLKLKDPNAKGPLDKFAPIFAAVGLAYAVRPENLHMLHFLNTFIQDFVRNGDHITLRDKWFDILAKRN